MSEQLHKNQMICPSGRKAFYRSFSRDARLRLAWPRVMWQGYEDNKLCSSNVNMLSSAAWREGEGERGGGDKTKWEGEAALRSFLWNVERELKTSKCPIDFLISRTVRY